MSDKRPLELASYIAATAEKNDALILEALRKLETVRPSGKLKATVSSICELTGLSRNTVRNRQWALDRLKAIKQKLKSGPIRQAGDGTDTENEVAILDGLRKRIRRLLEQNALLYEEILSLRRIIERKDAEIKELKSHKLEKI